MYSWDKNGDRVAILQMNAELRHAQLELLSAQCATDRLRLRFSTRDLAQHAQRDVLRKALSSATALHEYYTHVAGNIPSEESLSLFRTDSVDENRVQEIIIQMAQFFHERRGHFRPLGVPLSEEHRRVMMPFFPTALLEKVGVVVLNGERLPNPPFYEDVKACGFTNLPELTHMSSVTFEDVLIFHSEITERSLFHALVHAVQFEVLGLEQYAEHFVRGFVRTRSYISVPLEAHAFTLQSKFAGDPAQPFAVEEKVRLWANQGRYHQ